MSPNLVAELEREQSSPVGEVTGPCMSGTGSSPDVAPNNYGREGDAFSNLSCDGFSVSVQEWEVVRLECAENASGMHEVVVTSLFQMHMGAM